MITPQFIVCRIKKVISFASWLRMLVFAFNKQAKACDYYCVLLDYGQQIARHQVNYNNCQTPIATLTYLLTVCADDNANRQVNWGVTGAIDK